MSRTQPTEALKQASPETDVSREYLADLSREIYELDRTDDRYFEAAQTQVLNRLEHAQFQFQIRAGDEDYPHALPNEEGLRYLRQSAVDRARALIGASMAEQSANAEFDRQLLVSDSAEAARAEQQSVTEAIVAEPLASYRRMREAIAADGLEARLPELRFSLEYLVHSLLDNAEIEAACQASPMLGALRQASLDEATQAFQHADASGVPYRATNLAIEHCLEVLDVYSRGQTPAPALYHSGRYEYYFQHLLADPDHITLPTPADLTSTDLLKVRGVPIGLIGANVGNMRVDGFVQTPYEFFQHDINHSRRMYQFFSEYAAKQGLTLDEMAESSSRLMEEVLLPPLVGHEQDNEETANIKIWARMLLFEILHEDALAARKDVIVDALFRPALRRTPFEDIDHEKGIVTYVMEEGATTLAYLFRKMKHDFYDLPSQRSGVLGDEDHRSRYAAVEAALFLLGSVAPEMLVKPGIVDDLEQLVATDEGFPEAYFKTVEEDIERRIGAENTFDMLVSIPSDAAAAIEAVRKTGKKIITLYGFSDLEYADPEAMTMAVDAELARHDPEESAIVIGATEVGIGAAYKLAKNRGFATIGIVSTKAIAHGGKFSPAVDQIEFIKDPTWGGYLSDGTLSQTTRAFVESADEVHAFGGGNNTVAALREAARMGKPVTFVDLAPQMVSSPTSAREYWLTK